MEMTLATTVTSAVIFPRPLPLLSKSSSISVASGFLFFRSSSFTAFSLSDASCPVYCQFASVYIGAHGTTARGCSTQTTRVHSGWIQDALAFPACFVDCGQRSWATSAGVITKGDLSKADICLDLVQSAVTIVEVVFRVFFSIIDFDAKVITWLEISSDSRMIYCRYLFKTFDKNNKVSSVLGVFLDRA